MTTFTSEDRQEAYKQKVEEAPYHPGYEDAVIPPTPAYKGINPTKMLWKPKPLTDEEIVSLLQKVNMFDMKSVVRAIEERHGIK